MSNSTSTSSAVLARAVTMGGPSQVTTSEGETVSLATLKQLKAVMMELENSRKLAQMAGLNPGFSPRKIDGTDPAAILAAVTQDDSEA
jgi:hypothetical protein